ncbi:precorrin-6y C5,15-methyltransferase (decarboxylating) subunit CbiE [Solirubrobacter sp. CPCC 204708]|uniref:Precorrin-6y C5,15-methyltransferase (Decarboxylating) subunit CbiE n=1 Tax=Solirubrobacter deserti TaxID=2282478 RepID=A0ABT4RE26_9ACTN|nr:precorrin-6y C5,15-methyltransferase (decarboxylating) subunit CbiE [Solirubrobacter deserti]MBE2316023.1 precorrin-6y C5,15-methyltransferase (decarboxylating) subunit CbiE [Solirubrobacter deserti]MDA0136775.1 precorrin-6y C5,15-methyltransferase (decarboxylating) subunit CbiE [Solirubrobacter deserti]
MLDVLGVSGGRVPPGTEPLLERATVVAGGRAVLEQLAPGKEHVVLGKDLDPTLRELVERDAVVLASGDPGFFGIVRALAALDAEMAVHPAPSSVALAFARLGVPWDDALVVSAHGRDPHAAINAALRHPKVAILTQPGNTEAIVDALRERDPVVAEALGTPHERLATEPPFSDPNVVIVHAPTGERATVWPPRTPTRWALDEDAFEHRRGLITKAEVRALALSALGPGTGDHVWDVGCGSGSVGIECARLGAAVTAIDTDPDAIELTTRNAAAHGVPVTTVHGRAPDALRDLRDPDAVFVGGGGPVVLDGAMRARRAVVVALALIDRVAPTIERLSHGFEVTATTLQASRVKPIADGHRLAAENPVTVVVGRR